MTRQAVIWALNILHSTEGPSKLRSMPKNLHTFHQRVSCCKCSPCLWWPFQFIDPKIHEPRTTLVGRVSRTTNVNMVRSLWCSVLSSSDEASFSVSSHVAIENVPLPLIRIFDPPHYCQPVPRSVFSYVCTVCTYVGDVLRIITQIMIIVIV